MSKTLKEFMLRQTTGQVDLEFDDDSTSSYNMKDVVVTTSDPVTGRIGITTSAGRLAAKQSYGFSPQVLDMAPVTTLYTMTEAAFSGNLANAWQCRLYRDVYFTSYGGPEASTNDAVHAPYSATGKSSNVGVGTVMQTAPYMEFMTTAQNVRWKIYATGGTYTPGIRVAVDGQYVGTKAVTPYGAVGVFRQVSLSLGSSAVAKKVRIEWDSGAQMSVLSWDTGLCWADREPIAPQQNWLFFGDSHFANGANRPNHLSIGARIARKLGVHYTMSALGGTGYVNPGVHWAATDAARIADMSRQFFDAAVIALGTNDWASTDTQITAAAITTLSAMRSAIKSPRPIFVIGHWNAQQAGFNGPRIESAIEAAVVSCQDPNIHMIRCTNDLRGQWIAGPDVPRFIDADGTHASAESGEDYFSSRAAARIRDILCAGF